MAAPLARVKVASRRLVSIAETAPFRKRDSGPGAARFGPYVIHERLGEGGMAYVDRAEMVGRDGFRKPVALKRMRSEWAEDEELIEAFVHEAQLASQLSHPNIAQASPDRAATALEPADALDACATPGVGIAVRAGSPGCVRRTRPRKWVDRCRRLARTPELAR